MRILSIGCGQKPFQVTEGQVKTSGMAHWKNIIDVAMYFQSVTAVNQAGLLIGRDRIARLDRPDGSRPIDLDDWKAAKELLPTEAQQIARENASHLATTFLAEPASPFTPLA